MKIQFNNGGYVETSNTAYMCRKDIDGQKVVYIRTQTRKAEFNLKNAKFVSGMKGNDFPYTFSQNGNKVNLHIHNSSNPVNMVDHDPDSLHENTRRDAKKVGSFNINSKSTVTIGEFGFTAIP